MLLIPVQCVNKITQTDQVLIDHSIPDKPLVRWFDQILLFFDIVLSNEVNGHAECVEGSKEEDHEIGYIFDSSNQKFDIERGLVKQSEPLKEFEAEEQNDKRRGDPHSFSILTCYLTKLSPKDDSGCRSHLDQIEDIADAQEILFVVFY